MPLTRKLTGGTNLNYMLILLLGGLLLYCTIFVDWFLILRSIGFRLQSREVQTDVAIFRHLVAVATISLLGLGGITWRAPQFMVILAERIGTAVAALTQSPGLIGTCLGIIILLKTVLQLTLHLAGFRHYSTDDYARILKADYWLSHFQDFDWASWLSLGSPWLPFPDYLFGLGLHIHRDLYLTPRLMNLALSALIILVLYRLGRALFGRLVGLLSAVIFAFMPLPVWLGISSMTSDLFSMLMIALFALALVQGLRKESPLLLLVASCCLFVANGIRYENWFFSAVFSLTVPIIGYSWRRRPNRHLVFPLLGAIAIATVYPLIHLITSYLTLGDWLPARHHTAPLDDVTSKFNIMILALYAFPFETMLISAGIMATLRSGYSKTSHIYLLLVGATFLLVAAIFKFKLPIALPRVILPFMLLLLPYGSVLLQRLWHAAACRHASLTLIAVLTLALLIGTLDIVRAFHYPTRSLDTFHTGNLLRLQYRREPLAQQDKILVERLSKGWIPFALPVMEGHPQRFVPLPHSFVAQYHRVADCPWCDYTLLPQAGSTCIEDLRSIACQSYLSAEQIDMVIVYSPERVHQMRQLAWCATWQLGRYHIFDRAPVSDG